MSVELEPVSVGAELVSVVVPELSVAPVLCELPSGARADSLPFSGDVASPASEPPAEVPEEVRSPLELLPATSRSGSS